MIGDLDFEGPLFKRLSLTDTRRGRSNQAGILIPKGFRKFFPALPPPISGAPAPSARILSELVLNTKPLGLVDARFQSQTRGGTRSGELRLTDILPLHREGDPGDIFLIERSAKEKVYYRFTLIKETSPVFAAINLLTSGKDKGELAGAIPFSEEAENEQAENELDATSGGRFEMFGGPTTKKISMRIARSRAFRLKVTEAYERKCAVCGKGFRRTAELFELEAGHIVSKSSNGIDDVRNGLAFCRSHHWAFDAGLISVDLTYGLLVARDAGRFPENADVVSLKGSALFLPPEVGLRPHKDALDWHRAHVFERKFAA